MVRVKVTRYGRGNRILEELELDDWAEAMLKADCSMQVDGQDVVRSTVEMAGRYTGTYAVEVRRI